MSSWTSMAAVIVVAELVLKLTLVVSCIGRGCRSRSCRRSGCRRRGCRRRGCRRRGCRAVRLLSIFCVRAGTLLRTGADDNVHGAARLHLRAGSWVLFDDVTRRHPVVRDFHLAAELQTCFLEDLLGPTDGLVVDAGNL